MCAVGLFISMRYPFLGVLSDTFPISLFTSPTYIRTGFGEVVLSAGLSLCEVERTGSLPWVCDFSDEFPVA